MKKALWLTVVGVIVALFIIPPSCFAQVKVKLLNITETRYSNNPLADKTIPESNIQFSSMNKPGLLLMVELQGAEVKKATKYGLLQIAGKDETGTVIKQQAGGFHDPGEELIVVDRDSIYMSDKTGTEDKLKFEIRTELPSRAAKKVDINGTITLSASQPTNVDIISVKTKIGQSIKDKVLTQAGITIKIVDSKDSFFAPDDAEKAVSFEASGKLNAILDVKLLDDKGNELSAGQMTSGMSGGKTYLLDTSEKLPKNTKLRITIALNEKSTKVPISLKNIPLP